MTTIPQNDELLKHLLALLSAHRVIFKQERVYQRVVALVLGEVFTFARHTVTQLLMSLGLTAQEWSAWYRLFSRGRFQAERASAVLLTETLAHVAADEVYVVASGNGEFVNGGVRRPFETGELLFVPAGIEHRFENFSDDFSTWVIFYGPEGGEAA